MQISALGALDKDRVMEEGDRRSAYPCRKHLGSAGEQFGRTRGCGEVTALGRDEVVDLTGHGRSSFSCADGDTARGRCELSLQWDRLVGVSGTADLRTEHAKAATRAEQGSVGGRPD